jgi:hypothetical protein
MFGWIDRAWQWATGHIDSTVAAWVRDIVHGIYGFLHSIFGKVGTAWGVFTHDVAAIAAVLDHFGNSVVAFFYHIWRVWIPALGRWITRTILDPLLGVLRWLRNQGETMWHYFTHPEQFATLLAEPLIIWLEKNAWAVAGKLSSFFLSLFLRNMRKFLALAEDIIHAVL